MKRQTIKTIITLLFLTVSLDAYAQLGEIKYDTRVKSKLDSLDINYQITDVGSFKIIFNMVNDRTQMVIIPTVTEEYGGMEIREIYSIAESVDSKDSLNQNDLFTLLELNKNYKIGSWQIHGGSKPYLLRFAVKLSANATQSVLDLSIRVAAKIADEMELKLTSEDEF